MDGRDDGHSTIRETLQSLDEIDSRASILYSSLWIEKRNLYQS